MERGKRIGGGRNTVMEMVIEPEKEIRLCSMGG